METKIFEDFELQEGKEKIILSAPHAFIHLRDGEIRYAETNTDTIVKELADELKVYGIYKTYNSDNDANHDEKSLYRDELIKQVKRSKIKFLIDFHGMACERDEDICLGTAFFNHVNGDKEFIDEAVKIFNKHGFKNVTVDNPFDSSFEYTVSSQVHEVTNIYTLQIEINGKYRLPDSELYNLKAIKDAVKEIINAYKKIGK